MAIVCSICYKVFSTRFNLNKHCRIKHNIEKQICSYPESKYNFQCLNCTDCSFRNGDDLIGHLQDRHTLSIQQEEKDFVCIEEFKSWKLDVENKEKCCYVICGGKIILNCGDEIQYFRCCRSGNQKDNLAVNVNRRRKIKSQGSAKLDYACISKITLRKQQNKLYAKRIITHYGHTNDIKHLRLSELDKQQLAVKLIDGVSTTEILNDIRNNIAGTDLKRINLTTRQDLDNIKKRFNINQRGGIKHEMVADGCIKSSKTNDDLNCDKQKNILRLISDLTVLTRNNNVGDLSDRNFQLLLSNLSAAKNLCKLSSVSQEHKYFKDNAETSTFTNTISQGRFFHIKKRKQSDLDSTICKNFSFSESVNKSNILRQKGQLISRDVEHDHDYL